MIPFNFANFHFRLRPKIVLFGILFTLSIFPRIALAIDPNSQTISDEMAYGLSSILEIANQQNAAQDNRKWWMKVSAVDPSEVSGLFTIEPALGPNGELVAHVKLSANTLQDPVVMGQLHAQLESFRSVEKFENPRFVDMRHWAEIFWNAKSGDVDAQLELKKFEQEALKIKESLAHGIVKKSKISISPAALVTALSDKAKSMEKEIQDLEKKVRENRLAAERKWKEGEGSRQKWEKDQEKLDDLLKKNDRKGVRALVETYLPWDSMGSTEKNAWKQWLEALENPSQNPEDTVLVFRGLDSENRLFLSQDGKPGFMAPMLIRNQGNYSWRMRSYRTKRDRFGTMAGMFPGGVGPENRKPSEYVSVMAGLRFHSNDPMGTPYISVSDYSTASRFADDGIVAVQVDKRRLLPNNISTYPEAEKLIPLLIFPDEIKHYKAFSLNDTVDDSKKAFRQELEAKLGRSLTDKEIGERLVGNNELIIKFRDQSLDTFVKDYIEPNVAVERFDSPIEKYDVKKSPSLFSKVFASCKTFFADLGGKD